MQFCKQFYNVSVIIVIRNRKIVWKHGPYYWYFCMNIKFLREYIKTVKITGCSENFLCGDEFDAISINSRFYSDDADLYESVKKTATDDKD